MSRSHRKLPIVGNTTSESEKRDKRTANRRLRGAVRLALHEDPHATLPVLREVSDVWVMNKDGKQWFDADKHPNLMRK